MDRSTRYRDLLAFVSRYDVYEDPTRAKGSERLWIRVLPDGRKRSIPVTYHGPGYVIGVGLVKVVRRRLLLTAGDGISDEEFYSK